MKNLLLVLTSLIVGLLLCESILRVLAEPGFQSRIMMFQAGDNFKNQDEIFTYYPNQKIRSNTFYNTSDKGLVEEYDYLIETNNLGLVQKRDIDNGAKVHLVLGDSFTEGQGASPWFYALERDHQGALPLVNGGLLGTGPMQWEALQHRLQQHAQLMVERLTIVMIDRDIERPIWNFTDEIFECLRFARCDNKIGQFAGMDFQGKTDAEVQQHVASLVETRSRLERGNRNALRWFLKSSLLGAELRKLKNWLRTIFMPSRDPRINNLKALQRLLTSVPQATDIVLISTKNELTEDGAIHWGSDGQRIQAWAQKNGHGIRYCELAATDFHFYDDHPNAKGYKKVRQCVQAAIQTLGPLPTM